MRPARIPAGRSIDVPWPACPSIGDGWPSSCCLAVAVVRPAAGLAGGARSHAAEGPPGAWLPSPDLVVGEVVTGGASASDEWIEIHDRGGLAADLGGLELVYVTATGGTVTRKASWQAKVRQARRQPAAGQ